ncbi:MAG TPA: sigma-70 family RNA polymerase sigma factor [Acetobacteraceae bacterium]
MADNEPDQLWSALMAAAQDGDAIAYHRLLTALPPFLRILLRQRHVSPERIEDITQDTLLTLHRVRHTYDPGRPFIPWLAAIATRRAIDARRRNARIAAWEAPSSDMIETFIDPESNKETDARDHQDELTRAMAGLTGKQREALELVKLREMSVAEAAAVSGQTPGAIKVNTHRAIRALRALLQRE